MKVCKLLLLLTSIILFDSCRPDDFSETPGTNLIPIDMSTSVTGDLVGLVVDENQQAIVGASVELNGLITSTDENGVFSFDNATALTTGSLVNIRKEGYYDGFKFTSFETGQNSLLKVQLVTKKMIHSFESSEEANIDVNGAKLYLPGNITTRVDGSPFNGVVHVNAHWYDPTDANSIADMPGDLRGISTDGSAVQLTTYGMMAVELSDGSGEELILKEGMKATLTLPLPQNANGPDEIPMWHLDEQTGIWMEEGKATKVGSAMVADVSHFSFWNCDDPFEVVNLKGTIISGPAGIGVSGLQVVITDNNQMISGYGYTNNQGVFSGAVPMGNDLSMSIYSCDELITFSEIGILTEDTNLGFINVTIPDQVNVVAYLYDCAGVSLENGIGIISTDSSLDIVSANMGQVNRSIYPCTGGVGTFQAYNNETNEASEELSFDLSEPFVELLDVKVCGGDIEEEITFTFQQGPAVTLSDVTVSIVDDTYLHIYAEDPGSSPLTFIQLRYYLDGVPQDMGFQNQIYLSDVSNNNQTFTISDPGATWNNVTGLEVGDIVSGVLVQHPTIDFSVAYNLTIDQIVKTSTVAGHIWIDTNTDGIRQSIEDDVVPEEIVVFARTPADGFKVYYQYFDVDSNGAYTLKGLADNLEYELTALIDDFTVTSYQQGSDPTIDNDFISGTGVFGNKSAPFILGVEETLQNIGLGIYK